MPIDVKYHSEKQDSQGILLIVVLTINEIYN